MSDLHALLDGFESDGVAVVPLKGPALGELLYRDPTTRAFTDLDLYVAAADADRLTGQLYHLPTIIGKMGIAIADAGRQDQILQDYLARMAELVLDERLRAIGLAS